MRGILGALTILELLWMPAGTPPPCTSAIAGAVWYSNNRLRICTGTEWKANFLQEKVVCIPAEKIDSGEGIPGGFRKNQALCVFMREE